MRALAVTDNGVAWVERPVPVPQPGEALVRVRMAGVCNTDLEIARGYMQFKGVLGHELCGVVEQCADARWIGRRVAGEINLGCGACELCKKRMARHCQVRTVLGILGKDGCFATHVTLPLANLHSLPDALPDEAACFVEPTAAAFEIIEQLPLDTRDSVLVVGDGKLALLIAQVIMTTGATLTLVGKHESKLAVARALGITVAARDTLEKKSFDVVIEATGSPSGMHDAISLVKPRGKIVLKSTYHGPLTLDAAPIVIDELSLIGSRCGPFEPAIAALVTGAVRTQPLVSAIVPFADAPNAFARASAAGTLKVLLDMRE
jgi:2-desacetyl-2-hydroxyethyl bacteriochlorophyllide A dehydrogenase